VPFINLFMPQYIIEDNKKKIMIGWRKYEVEGPRPRGRPKRTWREFVEKDCRARILNKDALDRSRWWKLIKDVWWPGWVWMSECFFWYWPTRVVSDKRPLNGCVCVCVCVCPYVMDCLTYAAQFSSPVSSWQSQWVWKKTLLTLFVRLCYHCHVQSLN